MLLYLFFIPRYARLRRTRFCVTSLCAELVNYSLMNYLNFSQMHFPFLSLLITSLYLTDRRECITIFLQTSIPPCNTYYIVAHRANTSAIYPNTEANTLYSHAIRNSIMSAGSNGGARRLFVLRYKIFSPADTLQARSPSAPPGAPSRSRAVLLLRPLQPTAQPPPALSPAARNSSGRPLLFPKQEFTHLPVRMFVMREIMLILFARGTPTVSPSPTPFPFPESRRLRRRRKIFNPKHDHHLLSSSAHSLLRSEFAPLCEERFLRGETSARFPLALPFRALLRFAPPVLASLAARRRARRRAAGCFLFRSASLRSASLVILLARSALPPTARSRLFLRAELREQLGASKPQTAKTKFSRSAP